MNLFFAAIVALALLAAASIMTFFSACLALHGVDVWRRERGDPLMAWAYAFICADIALLFGWLAWRACG